MGNRVSIIHSIHNGNVKHMSLIIGLVNSVSSDNANLFVRGTRRTPSNGRSVILDRCSESTNKDFLRSFDRTYVCFGKARFLTVQIGDVGQFHPSHTVIQAVANHPLRVRTIYVNYGRLKDSFIFDDLTLIRVAGNDRRRFKVQGTIFHRHTPHSTNHHANPFTVRVSHVATMSDLRKAFPITTRNHLISDQAIVSTLSVVTLTGVSILTIHHRPKPFRRASFLSDQRLITFRQRFPRVDVIFPFLLDQDVSHVHYCNRTEVSRVERLDTHRFVRQCIFTDRFGYLSNFRLRNVYFQ